MDRLELIVGEGDGDEGRVHVAFVEERLEVIECRAQVVEGRWNERCRVRRVVRRADPVLRAAELAGVPLLAAYAREQSAMHFAEEPCRQGKFGEHSGCRPRTL